ncbi:MAG: hypothetical protein ACKOW5_17155 [Actinomycetales bacterium]
MTEKLTHEHCWQRQGECETSRLMAAAKCAHEYFQQAGAQSHGDEPAGLRQAGIRG